MKSVKQKIMNNNTKTEGAKIAMCSPNFGCKVCERISDEEFNERTVDEETEDVIYTNKSIVKKIWSSCFKHGYILQAYGIWPDKLIIRI
jgi:hypothetical protein